MAKEQSNRLRGCDKPISTRTASVVVEYTRNGERVTKFFEEAYKARAFYQKKDAEGRQPKIIPNKENSNDQD